MRLSKWFFAIFLIIQSNDAISALSLKRYIGVTHKTAWKMKQKLKQATIEKDTKQELVGFITVIDAYLSGRPREGK